jgi:hypothetical protein
MIRYNQEFRVAYREDWSRAGLMSHNADMARAGGAVTKHSTPALPLSPEAQAAHDRENAEIHAAMEARIDAAFFKEYGCTFEQYCGRVNREREESQVRRLVNSKKF